MTLFPDEGRVADAQKRVSSLKTEQARGSFLIAQFYEKYKRWVGAMVYYNEVILQDPESSYATQARERLDKLKKKIEGTPR